MDTDNLSSRKLKRLHRSHMRDAELDEVFLVLSVGASLIATLGLLANSTAVVIGAMVVAPWITPLRAAAFAILLGEVRLLGRSLRTLLVGVSTTTLLSLILGLAARLPQFGTEVLTRTAPNLLDLGIALVAGGLATYAKLRSDAVSSMAGTAIAVALVPPICVMGLLLSHQRWSEASGAGLLFTTNLLGILTGGLVLMAWKDRQFRHVLRRSHLSAASFLLTGLLLIPLGSSFVSLLGQARKDNTRDIVQRTIQRFLTKETLTFGDPESVDVERSKKCRWCRRKSTAANRFASSTHRAWDQNTHSRPVILVVDACHRKPHQADSNPPPIPRSKSDMCRWCRRKSTAANRFASGWWFNAPQWMSLGSIDLRENAEPQNPTKTALSRLVLLKRASCRTRSTFNTNTQEGVFRFNRS